MKLFEKFSHREKKELTPQQEKVKIALNWTVNVLCIILIIFALVVAIFTIIRSANPDHITRVGDNCYFSVGSDSMEPTFCKDDIIIAKYYEGDGKDLKVGQVITFKFIRYVGSEGYDDFNSHRIIHIDYNGDGSVAGVRTRGDKKGGNWQDALNDSSTWDLRRVPVSDIVATWGDVEEGADGSLIFRSGKMMKGVGGLANFMQDPVDGKTRFFCLIVLPLILLFVIYAFILVRTLIIAKLERNKKVAGETAISVETMTEEEKQALIAQLLASQKTDASVDASQEQAESASEEKTENAEENSLNEQDENTEAAEAGESENTEEAQNAEVESQDKGSAEETSEE